MAAGTLEQPLRKLVDAIVDGDDRLFASLLSPALATACFHQGATRQGEGGNFIEAAGAYIYSGDTALHFAAAMYRTSMVDALIKAGANVRARNRRGGEPLHVGAVGSLGSARWDPAAQASTIVCLINAGADPNAQNMDGATPLHRAVRTRCAAAVRALLEHGAEPSVRNKRGSTALDLASVTSGRGGAGSPEAKEQQREIIRLLQDLA